MTNSARASFLGMTLRYRIVSSATHDSKGGTVTFFAATLVNLANYGGEHIWHLTPSQVEIARYVSTWNLARSKIQLTS